LVQHKKRIAATTNVTDAVTTTAIIIALWLFFCLVSCTLEMEAGSLTEGCELEFLDSEGKNDPWGAGRKDVGILGAEGAGPGDDTGLSFEDSAAGDGEGTSTEVWSNSLPKFLLGTGLGTRD
jgi:hypothetical protein